MKKAIVVGASSGIGHEVARLLIAQGWAVGVAARRIDKLTDLQAMAPERVYTAQIDVTNEDAETSLLQLIERMKRHRPLFSCSRNRFGKTQVLMLT